MLPSRPLAQAAERLSTADCSSSRLAGRVSANQNPEMTFQNYLNSLNLLIGSRSSSKAICPYDGAKSYRQCSYTCRFLAAYILWLRRHPPADATATPDRHRGGWAGRILGLRLKQVPHQTRSPLCHLEQDLVRLHGGMIPAPFIIK